MTTKISKGRAGASAMRTQPESGQHPSGGDLRATVTRFRYDVEAHLTAAATELRQARAALAEVEEKQARLTEHCEQLERKRHRLTQILTVCGGPVTDDPKG